MKVAHIAIGIGAWSCLVLILLASLGFFQSAYFHFGPSPNCTVFGEPVGQEERRFSLFARDRGYDWKDLHASLRRRFNGSGGDTARMDFRANHAVLVSSIEPATLRAWLEDAAPALHVLSVGRVIDLYKDMGDPKEIAERYQFAGMAGSHCVGHTRMATESDVTPVHAHPFTAGEDFCLVHNGSLSNPYMLRRMLEKRGIAFETDNDTEAACRFIEWRLAQGDTLDDALHRAFRYLDGFYTLLMATADQMTLVRDPFACKPAVVAETDDYVAISSEFRSLAHLPNISKARTFEPEPEEIYSWKVSAPQ